jgi:light-regulated signal transduction histidine kinase (bacteriophytochrome)
MTKTTFEFPEQIDLTGFISEQAHDLKSPFNRILGFVKVVLNGLDGPLNDTQKEDLTTVFKNGAYAFILMSSLVDIARLSRGEKAFSAVDVDLQQLLDQSIHQWKQQAPARDVQIEAVVNTSKTSLVGDQILLRQLLSTGLHHLAEFLEDPIQATIFVEDDPSGLLFKLQATGASKLGPSDCDLTMYGYIIQAILKLHKGQMQQAEGDEGRAEIQFTLPA